MKSINKTLARFIEKDEYKVLAIKGAWGIGKTFYWKEYLKKNKDIITQDAYSYVSLFGVKDISFLKRQIFAKHIAINEKKLKGQIHNLKKSITSIFKSLKFPYINNSKSISEYFEDKFVKNFLICIDDIERKEDSISLSAILGLISSLKEEKGCKIVLIFNDSEMNEKSEKELNEYREKIIDIEIRYQPTIAENFQLVFSENESEELPEILKVFEQLNLNNIRIMQRVNWALNYFSEDLIGKYPYIVKPFTRKIAILTCLYHAFSNRIKFDEVLTSNYYSSLFSKDEEKNQRLSILRDVKCLPESYDIVIGEYLIDGYVDNERAKAIFNKANESYKQGDINAKHHAILDNYSRNFRESQDDFINKLFTFIKDNLDDLKLMPVIDSLDFIKNIDPSFIIDNVLDQCIDIYVDSGGKFEQHERQILRIPDYAAKRIKEKLSDKKEEFSISELMDALAGSNSWNPSEILKLEQFTEDDFYEWIVTYEGDNLLRLIREFIQRFGKSDNKSEKSVSDRLKKGLDKISDRSQIDRFRVENIIGYKKSEGDTEQNNGADA